MAVITFSHGGQQGADVSLLKLSLFDFTWFLFDIFSAQNLKTDQFRCVIYHGDHNAYWWMFFQK